ncbi:MAG: hypothetical protein IJU50_09965 [Lachnospiraceae bacterium]|nr:hypothetical protein [Lachnospiraceae bacterium]
MFEEKTYKLVAPGIDCLLNCFEHGWRNMEPPTAQLMEALKPLFDAVSELTACKENNEAKQIWITVPRGTIEDYGDFEEMKSYGEVKTRKQFEKRWREEYPDETKWYKVVVAMTDDERFAYRAVSVDGNSIVSASLRDGLAEQEELYSEQYALILLPLLTEAVKKSMDMLREGTYNDFVDKNLPYQHRIGVISRKNLWTVYPKDRESIFENLSEEVYRKFQDYLADNDKYKIGRMKSFTANDFFKACELGYKACEKAGFKYDCGDMTPVELYLHFADGRDEGLTGTGHGLNEGPGIDFDDPKAWDEWYFDKNRSGGHPWEVCCGGNSTHVDLFVRHDKHNLEYDRQLGKISDEIYEKYKTEAGYFLTVGGLAWNRSVEAVNFFVAIRDAGMPVTLASGDAILRRFKGEDNVGIVPWRLPTRYCEELFPDEYGIMLDFIHVFEDYKKMKDMITWLPEDPAEPE